ncbi:hypothetical protein [Streptomyces laculatispora]|uniref:hypothetical protein n=1 Tax=Streptomyces laculatispora TaxID=887464 RepID=UPI0027DADC20|nr:hypothetical protein [Streptomyces laculatispora]
MLTVVSADLDTTTGAGAVWVVWRPRSAAAREHTALLERHEGQWRSLGVASGPAEEPDDVDVIEVRGGGGTLCPTHRHDPPHSLAGAPWINSARVHLGQEVGRLLVGNRRIDAPEQRRLVVAWMTTQAGRGTRPLIVALGRDGTELSRLGPHDSLDTHTWARLREEL